MKNIILLRNLFIWIILLNITLIIFSYVISGTPAPKEPTFFADIQNIFLEHWFISINLISVALFSHIIFLQSFYISKNQKRTGAPS